MKIVISGLENQKEMTFMCEAEGKSLLSILRAHGIYVDAPCGGLGMCGRCRVRYKKEAPAATEKERKILTAEELAAGIRLACAVVPEQDCQIELAGRERDEIWVLTAGDEKQPVDLEEKQQDEACYGIAIDIGTTTLALALIDLLSGEEKVVVTGTNHQRAYGADVILRISAANEGKLLELQKSIQFDLHSQIQALLKKADIDPALVKKVVIVGNTTMCHLLRGLSCETLGVAPFTPVDIGMWKGRIGELFDAETVILPGISAFVGADIVAGIYGLSLHKKKEATMLLDIGTNGEMVIGDETGFLVTSAAAGPVFEGGNISCGVPGIAGAVTHVTWDSQRGASSCETIGDQPPVGLCGTGIIDAVSELVRHSAIDENGTLADVWFENGVPVAGDEIRFTQKDVREVQMGKSAIRAGIETLFSEYHLNARKNQLNVCESVSDEEENQRGASEKDSGNQPSIQVYLAGGFGYDMNVDSAIRIGLFPESFRGMTRAAGNAALKGAERFLMAKESEAVEELEWIVAHAREINLAMHTQFSELYMQYMFFGTKDEA